MPHHNEHYNYLPEATIIEAVISYSGDHSLDAELLALTRPIRHARIAAVNYAVAEWGRLKR